MGTTTSFNDEWIELLNNTDNTINLDSWILKSADEKLKISLRGQILAKGFYLLERTDDNSVLNIKADLVYKGALGNSGQDLKLYDSNGHMVDQVNYSSGWHKGDNITKQTMERVNSGNWQTSKDVNGTPKVKNSTGIIVAVIQNSLNNETLSKSKKSDSNTTGASVENTGNQIISQNFSDQEKETPYMYNPWLIFLISIALIIISAIVILLVKFTKLGNFFKKF